MRCYGCDGAGGGVAAGQMRKFAACQITAAAAARCCACSAQVRFWPALRLSHRTCEPAERRLALSHHPTATPPPLLVPQLQRDSQNCLMAQIGRRVTQHFSCRAAAMGRLTSGTANGKQSPLMQNRAMRPSAPALLRTSQCRMAATLQTLLQRCISLNSSRAWSLTWRQQV